MAVYRPKGSRTFWYDFTWRRRRYRASSGQWRREDAALVESRLKLRLRQEAFGVASFDVHRTPRFQDWAEIYYREASKRVTRPERLEDLVRVVLRFWGARPSAAAGRNRAIEGEPYHDLHLGDPITDPDWILQFETWMDRRARAGQTRNQYRSTLCQMFKLAMAPAWRKKTGVTVNPFLGIERDRGVSRQTVMTVEDVRALIAVASYHVRLAIAVGALAPKLRLANILQLRWREHLDRDLHWITVHRHKTAAATGRPLVVPVVAQLRTILEDARRRTRGDYVVAYRGRPVKSIRDGLSLAAARAGLAYGRKDGLTFHTVRHTAATLLAELQDLSEAMRAELMGHERIETTRGYTHIRPTTQIAPLERLSAGLPIADLVVARRTRGGAVVTANFGAPAAAVQTSARPSDALGDSLGATSEDTPETFGKSRRQP